MILSLLLSLSLSQLSQAQNEKQIAEKLKVRQWIISQSENFRTIAPGNDDRAEDLVDPYDINGNFRPLLTDLNVFDQMRSGNIAMDAWSDSYWPTNKGGIAFRYADPNSGKDENWKINFDLFQQSTPELKLLSPSEKYEQVIGDSQKTLTYLNWSNGKAIYDRFGKVADWIGICHGAAQAAHRKKRPSKPVTIALENGQNIIFYPADIKALESYLWATLDYSYRFIGGRCNLPKPNRDKNGRINEPDHPECADTNPATFHKVILNQIGDRKKSVVMDSINSEEVWNHPIIAYSFSYFNPKNRENVNSLAEAKALFSEFADPFKQYRSPLAVSSIGIHMIVSYLSNTNPRQEQSDSRENDKVKWATLAYDLELNAQDEIVGGEWYSTDFPDFLWAPTHDANPRSAGDSYAVENWNGTGALPDGWKLGIQKATAQGRPLPKLVDYLIEKSAN